MKGVSFVFATGSSWLDRLVTRVTRSPWSHVALRFDDDDILVEAQAGKGILVGTGGKYANWTMSLALSRFVADDVYEEMMTQAYRWKTAAVPYGYATCLAIGVKELCGLQAAVIMLSMLSRFFGETLVCSEMLVKLWRIAEPEFMVGQDCRLVSPDQLFQVFKQKGNQDKIDKPGDCAYNC